MVSVSPSKQSSKKNYYFDADIKTESAVKKVRIMVNTTTKRNLFEERCESKTPVKLMGLSVTPQVSFFNTNTGSRIMDVDTIPFKYEAQHPTKVSDINVADKGSTIDVEGKVRWLEEKRTIQVGENKITRNVRDGILADETGAIKVSVWGELLEQINENTTYHLTSLEIRDYLGVKLTTTSMTSVTKLSTEVKVDWSVHNMERNEIELCCPSVDSIKMHEFLQCINSDCKKKVVPFLGEKKVRCNNQTCNRTMLVSRCKSITIYELTLTNKENDKQYIATAFDETIKKIIDMGTEQNTEDEIEDSLLELTNVDFKINNKKIITAMTIHDDKDG